MGNILRRREHKLLTNSADVTQVEGSTTCEVDETISSSQGSESPSREDVDENVKEQWQKEQNELKKKLILEDTEKWQKERLLYGSSICETDVLRYVAGVDISFVKGDNKNACAGLVVVNYPEMQVVYEDCVLVELKAPYIPGFLAFREAGFLIDSINKLKLQAPQLMPQVIMVDGNGILHPREFGLACHLGVLIDIPCLGVAKKLFQVDGLEKNAAHAEKIKELQKGGDTFPLIGDSGKMLGKALRSCDASTNPVFVSPGHKISLDTAVWVVQQCSKHRVPEPVRQADIKSREYLRVNFAAKES